MISKIGSINSASGKELLKMWISSPAPAKRPLQRHSHTAFEIMAVLEGGGIYETKQGTIPFGKEDVFVFSSNETHYITEIGNEGLKMLNLHFEPRYLWGKSYDSPTSLNFCFTHSPDFCNKIPAHDALMIYNCLLNIRQEFTNRESEFVFAIKMHLSNIIISLIREQGYCEEIEGDREKSISIIKVMEYIDSNLSAQLTLSELAAVSGNSPTYFSSLFKKTCGITLWDYITAARIEKAVQLLLSNHELTVLDVACRVGFNNTANFNKAFKKQTGVTPKQIRNGEIYLH